MSICKPVCFKSKIKHLGCRWCMWDLLCYMNKEVFSAYRVREAVFRLIACEVDIEQAKHLLSRYMGVTRVSASCWYNTVRRKVKKAFPAGIWATDKNQVERFFRFLKFKQFEIFDDVSKIPKKCGAVFYIPPMYFVFVEGRRHPCLKGI